jgi:hypothetical protein
MRPIPWVQAKPTVLAAVLSLAIAAFVLSQIFTMGEGALRFREDEERAVMIFGLCCGGFFGLIGLLALVVALTCGNRIPRHQVDHEGLALWSRLGSAEIPWSHVLAAGVSYKKTPKAAMNAVSLREAIALEVFVSDDDPASAYPRAEHLLVTEDPPRPDLPRTRFRLVVQRGDAEARLTAEVAPYVEDRWLGEFQRQWNPVPGF